MLNLKKILEIKSLLAYCDNYKVITKKIDTKYKDIYLLYSLMVCEKINIGNELSYYVVKIALRY